MDKNIFRKNVVKSIELRHSGFGFIKNSKNMATKEEERNARRISPRENIPIVISVVEKDPKVNLNKFGDSFRLRKPIPKRIFFYWGGSGLSWMRYMTLFSFRKMNPDWIIELYVSDNNKDIKEWKSSNKQDYSEYVGFDYIEKLKDLNITIKKVEFPQEAKNKLKNISPIHESDLFRYYQLFVGGGFYCDTDVLFFKPIDDFYNLVCDGGYDTIVNEYKSTIDNNTWQTIGFLASSVNNDYYKNLFEYGVNIYETNRDEYQSMGALLIYKYFNCEPFSPVLDKAKEMYSNLNFYNLPTELIYFFDWTKVSTCFNQQITSENFDNVSIGYHWYGGCEESQKFNNLLNENNYFNYKTTFSEIAKEVLSGKFKKKERIRISIVTSYYNRKELFIKTLESISKSKFKNFELIAVDDCSSEDQRLEYLKDRFNFLKIIRLEKKDKWYINPCVPFNIGIKAALGEIIILQNPECLHVDDVLTYVDKNVDDSNYVSMAVYSLTNDLTKLLSKYIDNDTLSDYLKTLPQEPTGGDVNGWYNHSQYRPVHYHFCSAMTRSNMLKLNGFDERYSNGVGYDDNEFITRIKRLGLEMIIEDKIRVIHQYHPSVFYNMYNIMELSGINKNLFYGTTMKETKIKAN